MRNGPQLWADILLPIREAFGSGVIAGGAVRDFFLGEPPKDIDVFVNVNTADELVEMAKALPPSFAMSLMTGPAITEYETAPDWVSEVHGVLDGLYWPLGRASVWNDPEFRVQIIARPMPDFSGEALAARFDIGITRCWFDGQVNDTEDAAIDRACRTLTLKRWDTPEHVTFSMRRIDRLRSRFGYRLVDPRPRNRRSSNPTTPSRP